MQFDYSLFMELIECRINLGNANHDVVNRDIMDNPCKNDTTNLLVWIQGPSDNANYYIGSISVLTSLLYLLSILCAINLNFNWQVLDDIS